MRTPALIAALVVVLGACAGVAFGVRAFETHRGIPDYISIGTKWGHVIPGEQNVVAGHAVAASPHTKLLLDAQPAPYNRNHWRVIATTSQLGPGGSFSFIVYPRVRTRYKVLAAQDHLTASRDVGVIVDPPPKPQHR